MKKEQSQSSAKPLLHVTLVFTALVLPGCGWTEYQARMIKENRAINQASYNGQTLEFKVDCDFDPFLDSARSGSEFRQLKTSAGQVVTCIKNTPDGGLMAYAPRVRNTGGDFAANANRYKSDGQKFPAYSMTMLETLEKQHHDTGADANPRAAMVWLPMTELYNAVHPGLQTPPPAR